MNKTLLLLLLTALLLGTAALLLFLGEGDAEGRGRLTPATSLGESSEEAHEGASLALPSSDAPAPAAVAQGKSRSRDAAPAEPNLDRGSARLIEVEVPRPAGAPDEQVTLFAFSRRDGKALTAAHLGDATGLLDFLDTVSAEIGDALVWDRRDVLWGEPTTVGFHAQAPSGVLVLRSRYVWAPLTDVSAPGDTESVTLETRLGAWVTGQLVVAGDAPASLAERGAELRLLGRDRERGFFAGASDSREMRLHGALEFELRAINTDLKYVVAARAPERVPFAEPFFTADPGAHVVLTPELALGATLSGTVTSTEGEPIAGASIEAESTVGIQRMMSSGLGGEDEAAKSAADGTWTLRGVPPGAVEVSATAEDWLYPEEQEFEVADGQLLSGITFVLEAGGRIRGTVHWEDGTPVAEARVSAGEAVPRGWRSEAASTETAADGSFVLRALEGGPYDVTAVARRDGVEGAERPEESWRAGLEGVPIGADGLRLTLAPPLIVRGRVVDEAGAPLPAFLVAGRSPGTPEWPRGAGPNLAFDEAEDGAFELGGFYPGEWELHVSAGGFRPPSEPVHLRVPQLEPLTIALRRSVSVRGRVLTPDGDPLAGASVFAAEEDQSGFGRQRFESNEGVTQDDGTFELSDCPPDGFFLRAFHDDWAPSENIAVPAPAPGETPAIDLYLRRGATVTGEVFDAEGRPQVGMMVNASADGPFNFSSDSGAATDAAGFFRLERVTPGSITVTAFPGEETIYAAATAAGGDEQAVMTDLLARMRTTTVDVGDGEEVHVVLGVEPGEPVRVHGRVTRRGEALAGYSVTALEEGRALLDGLKVAVTDELGAYELTVDRPGAYVLSVGEGPFDDTGNVHYVDVPSGADYRQDLVMPTSSVRGVVLQPDGQPAAGVSVSLTPHELSGLFDLMGNEGSFSDPDGGFAFEGLRPGHYVLRAGARGLIGQQAGEYGAAVIDGIEVGTDEVVAGLEVRLSLSGVLAGVVRDREGKPVPGASIFPHDAEGRSLMPISATRSGAAGRFSLSGLPVGPVLLMARSDELCSQVQGPYEVRERASDEAQLVLETGCTLEVTILLDGDPVRGRLVVSDEAGRQVSGLVSLERLQDFFTAGYSTKERRIGPLAPGKYTLVARNDDGKQTTKVVTLREGMEKRVVKLRLK